jgi:hypothetical protein
MQPQAGTSGSIIWNLGDLAAPGNHPLQVAVQVRSDLTLGSTFSSVLTVTDGLGNVTQLRRTSRVGRYDRANPKTGTNGAFRAVISAPRQVAAGAAPRYTITIHSTAPASGLDVRSLLPAGVQVDAMQPAGTISTSDGGTTVVEWRFTNPSRTTKLRLYTHTDSSLLSGEVLENFVDVADGVHDQVMVVGTTMIR